MTKVKNLTMKPVSLIVATDLANGIGKANGLLCHLPKDLMYFKAVTMGKPIVMGHKTYQSIGRALPGRPNYVLSRNEKLDIPGIHCFTSLEKCLHAINDATEVMIIGGGSIYRAAMPFASMIYQTVIHHQFDADTFFPEINNKDWQLVDETFSQKDEKNPFDVTFKRYQRVNTL